MTRTYKAALDRSGLARKEKEDDARTPESHYMFDSHKPASHIDNFNISIIIEIWL